MSAQKADFGGIIGPIYVRAIKEFADERERKVLTSRGKLRRSFVVGFADIGAGAEWQEEIPKLSRMSPTYRDLVRL